MISTLWGAETRPGSCGEAVLADQPAEPVMACHPTWFSRGDEAKACLAIRRGEPEPSVWAVAVVVVDVGV